MAMHGFCLMHTLPTQIDLRRTHPERTVWYWLLLTKQVDLHSSNACSHVVQVRHADSALGQVEYAASWSPSLHRPQLVCYMQKAKKEVVDSPSRSRSAAVKVSSPASNTLPDAIASTGKAAMSCTLIACMQLYHSACHVTQCGLP